MRPITRSEVPSDASAIHAVTVAAFRNAPHADHTEQFIVEVLRQAGALIVSLVAEEGERVIGHVAVSPVSISDGSTGWSGLGPIYVEVSSDAGLPSCLCLSLYKRYRFGI